MFKDKRYFELFREKKIINGKKLPPCTGFLNQMF